MKTNVAASPALKIRIKKNADGSAALTLVRPDGTTTWQKQNGKLGRFFPLHDLTHYSVETALGYTNAFYGLVASGWDIGDFTTPWPRGRVPLQGSHSETIVGTFDLERSMGTELSSDELNDQIRKSSDLQGIEPPPPLSDDEIARVRALRAEMFGKWGALAPGEALEIPFDPTARANG